MTKDPATKRKIHFVGVGGVGMGSFAVALQNAGFEITGSDGALYEPMKGVLSGAGITLLEGFKAENLEKVKPDLVVIGNVVRRDNPEAVAWIRSGLPFYSFPEAVRHYLIRDKNSIICAGTHGKTTTTSWLSFLFSELGTDPSYLIGGVPQDLPAGCVLTEGEIFIGEGDEYDSAFFDKGPKFLHYNPSTVILSSVEFDHADIYKDLDHVKASFRKLVALLPGNGLCVARYDDPNVMELVPEALCQVQTFGTGLGAMWRTGDIVETSEGFHFDLRYKGKNYGTFETPLFGEHNLMNLISGIAVAVNEGHSLEKIQAIVPKFHGVRRRQEILLRDPVLLVDDFAHHPTEVAATLGAVRRRYPTGKLWALFEPRSATARRNVHQEAYTQCFDTADVILISVPHRAGELSAHESMSTKDLAVALEKKGKISKALDSVDSIVEEVVRSLQPGDRIVVMSNGEFGKIQKRLVEKIKQASW